MAVLPTGIGPVTGGYQIERSLRFNSADSAYLNRTPASAGSLTTWTWSGWVKRGTISASLNVPIFSAGTSGTNDTNITFNGDIIDWFNRNSSSINGRLNTTQVFRDPSGWYHLVFVWDTTNATASNRMRIYVNGSLITALSVATYPGSSQSSNINNNVVTYIGLQTGTSNYFDGYMTEINFIDGQALTPSDFGETDSATGVWKPKKYTGTYGTNGFYLNFSDNSNTTAATLGKDSSGNGNNWTPNNFSVTAGAGNDSLVDVPTLWGSDTGAGGEVRGNYCVISPINSNATILNGGLDVNKATSGQSKNIATISSNLKTYFEVTFNGQTGTNNVYMGVGSKPSVNDYNATNSLGYDSFAWAVGTNNTAVYKYNNNSLTQLASGASSANDIFMIAYDPPNGKIWFGKNGTWYGSGDPAAGTNAAFTNLAAEVFPVIDVNGASGSITVNCNFGQRPFAYTAPSGFKALCTTNLPTPTIGATSTTQAGKYFDVSLFTETGSVQSITNSGGFQPDLVWQKARGEVASNRLVDAIRGVNKVIYSNLTNAEATETSTLTAFNSNGYTGGGTDVISTIGGAGVAWQWNAGGSNATNTSGTITSTVRANTTAGFSIVSWAATGANATIGHGLGVAPSMIIMKNRDAATNWAVYHTSITAANYLRLNSTIASTAGSTYWQNTTATSTVFYTGTANDVAFNNMIAYCFAEVAGYSAFGSYTGNGSSDGPFVFLNFRPKFIFWKNASTTGDWQMKDATRSTYNVTSANLYANLSNAENSAGDVDFLSNGFKLRSAGTDVNGSGNTIIYAAFAESPFKYSIAR